MSETRASTWRLRHRCRNASLGNSEMNRPFPSRLDSQPLPRARSGAQSTSGVSPDDSVRRILSADLFSAGAVVEIEHGREIYRLRHTRKGKLILTK